MQRAIDDGDVEGARGLLPALVGRDPSTLDEKEMARAVVFLSSPLSSFTTGTNLVVDGALTRGIQL